MHKIVWLQLQIQCAEDVDPEAAVQHALRVGDLRETIDNFNDGEETRVIGPIRIYPDDVVSYDPYAADVARVREMVGVTQEQAEALQAAFHATFPKVVEWLAALKERATHVAPVPAPTRSVKREPRTTRVRRLADEVYAETRLHIATHHAAIFEKIATALNVLADECDSIVHVANSRMNE